MNKDTLNRIKELASTSKGPSSIVEKVTDDAGGILDCTSMSCLPRNVEQVKRIRHSLSKFKQSHTIEDLLCFMQGVKKYLSLLDAFA